MISFVTIRNKKCQIYRNVAEKCPNLPYEN